jgi:hypothetical protein
MKSMAERLLPAPINGGFRMEDYWIWCGSVIKADGKSSFVFFATSILNEKGYDTWNMVIPLSTE